ncbi:hypothetical protein H6P81_009853 [Aristolochia fimbriata]|uniref:Generative cell specific-1/HAP2 domain-containing protein n=1 Tax=Aristolochia fimbriata TaxID=158543 RepID=A0AAV7EM21_ARIFI|nr:hypothetical protein H6P81_009853 [Aristolochia fimbriata]
MIPERLFGVEILLKSKIEKCEKHSDLDRLDCKQKIVVNLAVPSRSSGGESSIAAELVENRGECNSPDADNKNTPNYYSQQVCCIMLFMRDNIHRDVPFKAEEHTVRTHKCEPDALIAKIVKSCERLKDQSGRYIEKTKPICCPCGPRRRTPSTCGNFFDTLLKGKANTAHCLRFSQDWFHVFEIGRRSLGFNVRIQVKKGTKHQESRINLEIPLWLSVRQNRTALSNDNFLRVHLFGDFVGYTSIPSFEDLYLVIPRQGSRSPENLGRNFSMWMLLERVRFLDGIECDKIGVSYEAFLCHSRTYASGTQGSCLHNQFAGFFGTSADQYEIENNLLPQYRVEGRFERINEHPGFETHSFSIGIMKL